MPKSRTLIGTAAVLALAVGALAAPASAVSDPKLSIGHGIPKAVVDVCVKNLDDPDGQIEAISNFNMGDRRIMVEHNVPYDYGSIMHYDGYVSIILFNVCMGGHILRRQLRNAVR